MLGYIVKYKRKKCSGEATALLTREEMITLLRKSATYTVFSASLVDMEQYRLNHPDENLPVGII